MDKIADLLREHESDVAWQTAVDRLISDMQARLAVEMAQDWARSLNSSKDSGNTDRARPAD